VTGSSPERFSVVSQMSAEQNKKQAGSGDGVPALVAAESDPPATVSGVGQSGAGDADAAVVPSSPARTGAGPSETETAVASISGVGAPEAIAQPAGSPMSTDDPGENAPQTEEACVATLEELSRLSGDEPTYSVETTAISPAAKVTGPVSGAASSEQGVCRSTVVDSKLWLLPLF